MGADIPHPPPCILRARVPLRAKEYIYHTKTNSNTIIHQNIENTSKNAESLLLPYESGDWYAPVTEDSSII